MVKSMSNQKLLIKDADCWKCNKIMKIALLFTGTGFDDPSMFPDEILAIAKENGVKIERRYSGMLDETYDANICPHCDAMFGRMFLTQYWYEEDSKIVLVESLDGDIDEQF